MSQTPNRPLRVGFVGLSTNGWASRVIAPTITSPSMKPYISLVAVSTTNPTSAQASANAHTEATGRAITPYSGPTANIAADPNVDFVAISVQAPAHKEALLPVLEAGKDFFIEWPMTAQLKDAEVIVKKAKEKGLRSIVGLQGRSARFAAKIRQTIKEGKIGTVRSTTLNIICPREVQLWAPYVGATTRGFYKKSSGITPLSVPGGHLLDILISVLGEFSTIRTTTSTLYPTITFVDAFGKPTGETAPSEFPDHYVIAGTLRSGVVVNVSIKSGYSFEKVVKHTPGFFWEIVGEEGVIVVKSKAEDGLMASMASIHEPELVINGDKVYFDEAEGSGAVYAIASAWKAFVEGKPSGYETYPDAEDGLKLLRVLAAIEASGETGNTMQL